MRISRDTYLRLTNVKRIFINLTGSNNGWSNFEVAAKRVATKYNGVYIFKDEEKLFELFQEKFPKIMKAQRINHVYELLELEDRWGNITEYYM